MTEFFAVAALVLVAIAVVVAAGTVIAFCLVVLSDLFSR
jgi:hypothetical protein